MITIYFSYFEKEFEYDQFQYYIDSMPQSIQHKIRSYHRWQDSHACLIGKLLLKEGLENWGFDNNLENLEYNDFGRPYMTNSVDFNISHSDNCVICGFSSHDKIGVDIEKLKFIDVSDFKSQWRQDEWDKISYSSDKYVEFYKLWTAKEAIVKAIGAGLSYPLKDIKIEKENVATANGMELFLTSPNINQNYIIHTATFSNNDVVNLVEVTF